MQSSWSGSPAEGSDSNRGVGSGPRTEYISQLENWRKGCPMDEEVAEAIVGSGEDETRRSNNKWCKLCSFPPSSFILVMFCTFLMNL